MLLLAGTVVFAGECGDGTLKVDLYGPVHVTKIWLDNNNADNTRPEEIYLAQGWFYLRPTDYGLYAKELDEKLENSPKELASYTLTAEDNWEMTIPSGTFWTYLAEIAPPEGYEQILKDGTPWKWHFFSEGEYFYGYTKGYQEVYNYLGYDGVRQQFFVV